MTASSGAAFAVNAGTRTNASNNARISTRWIGFMSEPPFCGPRCMKAAFGRNWAPTRRNGAPGPFERPTLPADALHVRFLPCRGGLLFRVGSYHAGADFPAGDVPARGRFRRSHGARERPDVSDLFVGLPGPPVLHGSRSAGCVDAAAARCRGSRDSGP